MYFPSIPPIKAWKADNQNLSDLRQPNKLCSEILHLQWPKNSIQRASKLGTTFVLNLSDFYKSSAGKITCDNFFTSLQIGRELLLR